MWPARRNRAVLLQAASIEFMARGGGSMEDFDPGFVQGMASAWPAEHERAIRSIGSSGAAYDSLAYSLREGFGEKVSSEQRKLLLDELVWDMVALGDVLRNPQLACARCGSRLQLIANHGPVRPLGCRRCKRTIVSVDVLDERLRPVWRQMEEAPREVGIRLELTEQGRACWDELREGDRQKRIAQGHELRTAGACQSHDLELIREAIMSDVANPDERWRFKSGSHSRFWSDALSDGLISQAQYDAARAAFSHNWNWSGD